MKQNYEECLAKRSHGKWKHALRHTLLLIGFLMGLGMMNAFAQEATGGLYMHKDWHPTNADGSKGYIQLETFVTGESMVVDAHIPTDIVVVVDQSGSMADAFDGEEDVPYEQQRLYALKQALTSFVQNVQTDAVQTGCNHKIAILGFANCELNHTGGRWNNTELLSTENIVPYASGNTTNSSITDGQYRDALQEVTAASISANGRHYQAIERVQAEGATYMQYGLIMAKNVLDKRLPEDKVYVDANGQTHDRAQVVVFFTDGYPGRTATYYYYPYTDYFVQTNGNYTYNNREYDNQTVADAAVTAANDIKNLGATVFTVGIFEGADPAAAFQTTMQQYYGRYTYWSTGHAAANGLLHFISSDYGYNEVTSWSGSTTSSQNTAGKFPDSKYMAASDADELSNVFGKIAQQSGGAAIEMGVETVVQDVISPDFKLDIPATGDAIKAYAPKCTGKDGNNLLFDEINDNGTLVLSNGVVTSGSENRLPNSIIKYVNYDDQGDLVVDDDGNPIYSETPTKYIRISGFNFDEMWCGKQTNHGVTTYHGRKLVLIIPIEIDGNTWGDGIETNGPVSVILPNGDELKPIEFNKPTADVVGEVWTEVVTGQPTTFTTKTIDGKTYYELHNPEDLAWFISWVNGRHGYEVNNTVTPHPEANAILMADVDMSAHNWVPIGINTTSGTVVSYQGTFDGNGHVITGLKNNAGKKFMNGQVSWVFPGMFNKVGDGGVVKNVFVLDADFRGQQRTINNKECFVHHGIIADTLLAGGTIYNCEAAGRITCNNKNPETDVNLIFGGLVGLNQGTVHSCMAMAELTAYTMGGMIGENRDSGSFSNGFTNGIYHYLGEEDDTQNKPIGGIAAINPTAGNINNCYVRFSRDKNSNLENTNKFGRIVGNGSFTTTSCYSPMYAIMHNDGTMGAEPGNVPMAGHGIQYSTTCAPSLMREAHSNDNMVSNAENWPVWTYITYSNGTKVPLLNGGTPMLDKLNAGVATGQASWKRTSAGGYATSPNGGDINGDYPILEFTDYKCVASADGIRIDYAASLDEMLDRHNTGNMNVSTNMPPTEGNWYTNPEHAATYSVTKSPAIYGGAINLYANDNTTRSTSTTAKTMVYIDENVSLLQDNTSSSIDAYTGQTLKSFSTEWPGDGTGERWHNVSSSLKKSQFGWDYHVTDEVEHSLEENPCDMFLNVDNDDIALYPSDARSFAVADFYCFYEPQYHWINFRRNGQSHWHMDLINNAGSYNDPENHSHIDYVNELGEQDNETYFIPGKGYLMAISTEYFEDHYLAAAGNKHEQFIQNRGTLNNGEVKIDVTADAPEWTGLKGYNLIGNPYQSYLDFEKFITENTGEGKIWSGDEAFAQTYAVYDPEAATYLQYKESTSKEAKAADQNINMHQGFMIRVSKAGTAKFTNDMRTNTKGSGFRGTENHYPLINFTLNNGTTNDVAVLELGRPENDGALKLRVGDTKGRISLRHDNQDFGILFRDITEGSQPLYFDTDEDGTFTLSWNTANADFSSLTLVDNLTGVKYDMLANDSYTFQGNASDYRSRFKVVIGRFTDVEENEEVVTDNFAFFDGSDWIVTGQGQLTITDMTGRTVYTSNLTNDQNRVSLNGVANGIYLMRVANGQNVNVQKIVVR